ncbi:MAG: transposase [Candidatus Hydrogenedentota bacterium]
MTQRGNRRADVFLCDADREAYLRFLRTYGQKRGLAIWAYCLMSNHVHLVAVPAQETSRSAGLRDAHTVYAMYCNTRTELSGHVWQGRFHSTVLDDAHLWAAVRYVENNPVRAGMVKRAEDYPWSSAAARCSGNDDPVLADGLPLVKAVEDWRAWLREPFEDEDACYEAIRGHTHTGRPCGAPAFVEHLERLTGRPLRPKTRGPKPGTKYKKRKDS